MPTRNGVGEDQSVLLLPRGCRHRSALGWTEPDAPIGSNLDPVVEATVAVLDAARKVGAPIYFTTGHVDRSEPPSARAQ